MVKARHPLRRLGGVAWAVCLGGGSLIVGNPQGRLVPAACSGTCTGTTAASSYDSNDCQLLTSR